MLNRRKFLRISSITLPLIGLAGKLKANSPSGRQPMPIVISTWKFGLDANTEAWGVIKTNGNAIDAVEKGVMVTESSKNMSVGLDALPDCTGHVTLDACIMDEHGNCGSVAFLERVRHPISVARKVMETTPHVMLVGSGAQEFAKTHGFKLEKEKLSPEAEKQYKAWKEKQKAEKVKKESDKNHDTIGMLALDMHGNLSGSCTTSGWAYKLRGRVGDSPIIGAGLFVDNEVGAAVATGLGEMVIRICGSHTVVELMRQGHTPAEACKMAVERIANKYPEVAKKNQVGFLAINRLGEHGAYSLQKDFAYAICNGDGNNRIEDSEYHFNT